MSHQWVKQKPFFLCCITFALFSSILSYAQDDQLKVERFTTENGLSSNVVFCILQDRKGYLWIGTNDGLNRYDGYTFKVYRSNPGDSNSLAGNSVTALCEDQDGNLWIGAGGLCRYNNEKNNFTKVPLINHKGASQIFKLNKEELLINSDDGYLSFNIHSLKSTPVKTPDKLRTFYKANIISRDNKENFYIPVTGNGNSVILKYQYSSKTFTELLSITGDTKMPDLGRVFFVDSRNGCWIGTASEGNLFHYLLSKDTKPVLKNFLVKKAIGGINQIVEDNDGKIWISAAKGLFKYDYSTNSLNEIRYNSSSGSTNSTLTMTVFQDRSGLIWIGSYGGLFKLNPAFGKFSHFVAGEHQNALKDNFILGLYPSAENKVWINYQWGIQSFSLLNIANRSIKHYSLNDAMFKIFIREICVQNSQFKNEAAIQKWIKHSLPSASPLSFPFSLIFDRQKQLWMCFGNLVKRIGDTVVQFKSTATILDEKILGDDIWIATDGEGLQSLNTIKESVAKYVFSSQSNSISTNHLTCLLTEENGNLWIGTKGGGLNYFDRQKNIFSHYTVHDGLSNNSIFSLVRDDKNRLWIGTANGLSCFDTVRETFKNFYRSDGLINSEYNRYSACRLPNGFLLMGGMDGIDYFHPDSVLSPAIKPQVLITEFRIFNKPVFPFTNISLDHDQNYVTIDFAAMDFRNTDANKFAYKMKGIDKDWVNAGNEHSISYATLAPGRYHFLVKVAGSDGTWNEVPAEIYFTISTPWWKTWWFYSLVGVLVISILYSIYRFRIQQLKRVWSVRSKISQDLHDEVGATLTSISFLSEVVKQKSGNGHPESGEAIEKIGEFSREMIGEMNDIVWAINPANDKFEKIEDRMRDFVSVLLAAKNIQLEFRSDDQLKNSVLGMQQRKNLYLIFKEAVNNAAKYSDCTSITVAISREGQSINLQITDNGKGFVPIESDQGNGLKNMVARAAEINARIQISSEPGKGTGISLSIPITQNAY